MAGAGEAAVLPPMRMAAACASGQRWRFPGLGHGFEEEGDCEGVGELGLETLRPA